MDKIFLTVLNMSLTGAFVIAAICIARPFLKKAPKIITYWLWIVASFRLAVPVSFESVLSLIPFRAQTIPMDIAMQPVPRINSGIAFVNSAVSDLLPAAEPAASVNPLQIWIMAGVFVWLTGAAAMAIYGVPSYMALRRKMREAYHIMDNIYESNYIDSPFVLGVFKPGIYLPPGLSKNEKGYILLHEQTHIRRCDHIIKIAAYFILCLHWFNPLVWIAFLLMNADMEMSCDERVLKEMGSGVKKDYSMSLLSLAAKRRVIGGSPLAFGEGGMKERIKNVLNFRKPSRIAIIMAVALVAALSIGLAANRVFNTGVQTSVRVNKHYVLENATDRDKLESMMSVTLCEDGSAQLYNALVSSYMLPDCTYAFENGELLIYAKIYSTHGEAAFGVKNGEVIARFKAPDKNTIVFESASVPLRAKEGARYVCAQQDKAASPVLTLYPGVPADPKAAKPLPRDEEGRYLLDHVISAVVDYPGEADITLYFEETGTGTKPVEVPFPIENTNLHMLRIDIINILPPGYTGFIRAVVKDQDGGEHYGNTLEVVYPGPQPGSSLPRKWIDYYLDGQMPGDKTLELELPEYPGTVFKLTPYEVKAVGPGGEKTLYNGMPVWSVYLADLTGDGIPK